MHIELLEARPVRDHFVVCGMPLLPGLLRHLLQYDTRSCRRRVAVMDDRDRPGRSNPIFFKREYRSLPTANGRRGLVPDPIELSWRRVSCGWALSLQSYGLCFGRSCALGLYNYGLYSYGLYSHGLFFGRRTFRSVSAPSAFRCQYTPVVPEERGFVAAE